MILHPGEFMLGSTIERIAIPDDIVARLDGKSSLGRLGLAHPLDGRLRRRRLGRPHHARALERGEPADHALPRHEDRPDQLLRDDDARRPPLRLVGAGIEVPGPARPHAEPVLGELQEAGVTPRRSEDCSASSDHHRTRASRSCCFAIAGRRFYWLSRLIRSGQAGAAALAGLSQGRRGRGRRGRRPAQDPSLDRAGSRALLHDVGLHDPDDHDHRGLRRALQTATSTSRSSASDNWLGLRRGLLRDRGAGRRWWSSPSSASRTLRRARTAPAASTAATWARRGSCCS